MKQEPRKPSFLQKHLDDLLILIGCGLILYGVSLLYIPAVWITAGVMCLILSVLIGAGGKS